MTLQHPWDPQCILKVKMYKSMCPHAWVCCHTSHHLTLWTVRNVSLSLSLDTFICQTEIINTIISPMLALYSVNRFKLWLCLFISDTWISERPLICLFHYTLALGTTQACKELFVVYSVFGGLWFWCPICKATKICHDVHHEKKKEKNLENSYCIPAI